MNEDLIIFLSVLATAGRVLGLVLLSIVTGWFLSYGAIKGKIFENIFISISEVFESVPVISFFPVVLILFITRIGGPLGVELAADFLVFTAVVWNIWIAEYQAFKTIPREMVEVGENYRLGFFSILRNIYIPFSIPRIVANLFPSVSDGFFYITVSEVFTIGVTTFQTFGVGTEMQALIAAGNTNGIILAFVFLALVIMVIIFFLRSFSKHAVAKYTVDTDTPVIRRGRFSFKNTTRRLSSTAATPFTRLSKYYRRRNPSVKNEMFEPERSGVNYSRYILATIGLVILAIILYSSTLLVLSVSDGEWSRLLALTPQIIIGLLYDYSRVAVVIAVTFVISITLGYYLAINSRAESVGVPLIQVLTAFPAPVYFPFVYIAFYPDFHAVFGPLTSEFFVITLAFISTFYYLFYSFWMGVKAMPSEYQELMKNLNMGFFSKMRRVIIPSTFPYLIAGISSTINSTWGGLMIGEYWPSIYGSRTLKVSNGLMRFIDINTRSGNLGAAAWASFVFGIVVVVFSIFFTRRMMDLARKRYVAEEGVFAA